MWRVTECLEYLHLVFLRLMDLLVVWVLELTSGKQRRRESQPEVEWVQNAETEYDDTVNELHILSVAGFLAYTANKNHLLCKLSGLLCLAIKEILPQKYHPHEIWVIMIIHTVNCSLTFEFTLSSILSWSRTQSKIYMHTLQTRTTDLWIIIILKR